MFAALLPALCVLGALALATLGAVGLRRLEELARAGAIHPLVPAAGALSAALAALALVWPYFAGAPPGDVSSFAIEPYVPVAAALVGGALAGRALSARTAGLALLSTLFVAAAAGPGALAINLAGYLPGYVVERRLGASRPRLAFWLQTLLLVGVGAALCVLRVTHPQLALCAGGVFMFAALRHVSFVRCARSAGEPFPGLCAYLHYMLFFPTCVGAMEVFDEFRERNLRSAEPPDLLQGFTRTLVGTLQLALALQIDASLEKVLTASHFFAVWGSILLLFVRSALAVSGIWALLEGTASLLGVRVRANFRGILLAANPAEFWHAWRGTMTRWLIMNVYVPLGGNRHHRLRNVAATFLVSTLWHCAGTAFLLGERALTASLLPVVAWGALSFAGVAVHGAVREWHPPVERPPLAGACVRALKIGGTWVYGSFTVTLLELAIGDPARFGVFLRRIAGL